MNSQQTELLEYLMILREGAVDTLMMAGMFFSKMERQVLPKNVATAYDSLTAEQIDEVIQSVTGFPLN